MDQQPLARDHEQIARVQLAAADASFVSPTHHGGFLGGESEDTGQPKAFARKPRDVPNDLN